MSFRDKFQRFMYGRNGADDLSRFLSYVNLVLIVLSMVASIVVNSVLRKSGVTETTIVVRFLTVIPFVLAILLMIFQYWRVFSKNLALQQKMNRWYLNKKYYFKVWQEKRKNKRQQAKIYSFFKCPKCGQKVRVPKGRGKICITCPKCKLEFIRKS